MLHQEVTTPDLADQEPKAAAASARVCMVPYVDGNPYQARLIQSIRNLGYNVETSFRLPAFSRTAHGPRPARPDILHLHWLPKFKPGLLEWVRVLAYAGRLIVLSALGTRIIWTVHNLFSHDDANRAKERFATNWVIKRASSIILHSPTAGTLVQREFTVRDPSKLTVIPHGNYVGTYPNKVSRKAARDELGLPGDTPVVLFLGNIRPYKGVSQLLDQWRSIPPDAGVLLVAGRPANDEADQEVAARVKGMPHVRYFPGFVPDDKIQVFLNACDFVVFPYMDVLTSGAVILAMSFGRACIAPRIGCIPDVLDERGAVLYDPTDESGLGSALREAIDATSTSDRMGAHNRSCADAWSWPFVARETIAAYRNTHP